MFRNDRAYRSRSTIGVARARKKNRARRSSRRVSPSVSAISSPEVRCRRRSRSSDFSFASISLSLSLFRSLFAPRSIDRDPSRKGITSGDARTVSRAIAFPTTVVARSSRESRSSLPVTVRRSNLSRGPRTTNRGPVLSLRSRSSESSYDGFGSGRRVSDSRRYIRKFRPRRRVLATISRDASDIYIPAYILRGEERSRRDSLATGSLITGTDRRQTTTTTPLRREGRFLRVDAIARPTASGAR